MTHTTVIQHHTDVYAWDRSGLNDGLVRWYCETKGCTSLGGRWTRDEAAARRGAAAHRARHNGGPKALRGLVTLEW